MIENEMKSTTGILLSVVARTPVDSGEFTLFFVRMGGTGV